MALAGDVGGDNETSEASGRQATSCCASVSLNAEGPAMRAGSGAGGS